MITIHANKQCKPTRHKTNEFKIKRRRDARAFRTPNLLPSPRQTPRPAIFSTFHPPPCGGCGIFFLSSSSSDDDPDDSDDSESLSAPLSSLSTSLSSSSSSSSLDSSCLRPGRRRASPFLVAGVRVVVACPRRLPGGRGGGAAAGRATAAAGCGRRRAASVDSACAGWGGVRVGGRGCMGGGGNVASV